MAALPDLRRYGIYHKLYLRNPAPARLYEAAIKRDEGAITSTAYTASAPSSSP